ncbi:uL30 family ribosomal protein [Candidatus Woesearchaeota archaeon]|nr:MAG: large subunit ribosomal protein L30 [archaeon GW2011_AR4]MBS3129171.1 uL30 family ribosomal protein [Candidatus Woesearchaeota archaeon]HIH37904.1 hypothetical protein [Candidatus Woesearchaeota archaeon]HIH48887.1 hypothetical protein [Candidatus Woesearchaeota archaeon]HIJ04031.1 hypothetical protein [Candidatus Woesearchaeota archaeon]
MGKEEKPLVAAILIRGMINLPKEVKDTLHMLRMDKKNTCVVYEATPSTLGMMRKVQHVITFGPITKEMYAELIKKRAQPFNDRTTDSRGKIAYNKFKEIDGKKIKPYFHLNNPKGGFGRIKRGVNQGGALGRREEMDSLIKVMM